MSWSNPTVKFNESIVQDIRWLDHPREAKMCEFNTKKARYRPRKAAIAFPGCFSATM
jgi:hypothetical protein